VQVVGTEGGKQSSITSLKRDHERHERIQFWIKKEEDLATPSFCTSDHPDLSSKKRGRGGKTRFFGRKKRSEVPRLSKGDEEDKKPQSNGRFGNRKRRRRTKRGGIRRKGAEDQKKGEGGQRSTFVKGSGLCLR